MHDSTLQREVNELVGKWIAQARATDYETSRANGYESNESISKLLGAMQYFISSIAGSAGRDSFAVEFMMSDIPKDIQELGMKEVTLKLQQNVNED